MKSLLLYLMILATIFVAVLVGAPAIFSSGSQNIFDAVEKGDSDWIKQYVSENGDINTVNKAGKSPLLIAIEKNRYNVFSYLLEQGADPNYRNDKADPRENQVIMAKAATNSDGSYLKVALSFGGDPNTLDSYGRPILLSAISHLENSKILIESGANINSIGANGKSALHKAIQIKNYDVAYYLLQQRADVSIRNKFGQTPIDIIKQFGDAGVNPRTHYYQYYIKVLEFLDIPIDSVPSHNF